MSPRPFVEIFPSGLIVSCQARPGDPLDDPKIMAAMAHAAEQAGAVGIRANGMRNVAAIRARCGLPIIAINKIDVDGFDVRITPTFDAAHEVAKIGPQAIALDATDRPRPCGEDLADLIRRIHGEIGLPVMADVSNHDEGLRAAQIGADAVATTLSGYTGGPVPEGPDLDLLASLADALEIPVIAEGRIFTPEQAAEAMRLGAHAVVIGGAITSPRIIAAHFVKAIHPPGD